MSGLDALATALTELADARDGDIRVHEDDIRILITLVDALDEHGVLHELRAESRDRIATATRRLKAAVAIQSRRA